MGEVEYSEGSLGINCSVNLREYPLKPEKYFLLKWVTQTPCYTKILHLWNSALQESKVTSNVNRSRKRLVNISGLDQ